MATGLLDAPSRRPVLRPSNGRVGPPPPPTDGGDDGGEPAPRRPLDNLRVAILFFIAAESMFFAALISALFVLRASLPVWPPPLQPRLPIGITLANTALLLASSVALVLAGRALSQGDRGRIVRWLTVAAVLGVTFLAVQGYEWVRLIGHGLTISSSTYGTTFYTLIGTHALHVAAALVWLVATAVVTAAGRVGRSRGSLIRGCTLYWHFVVALWLVLFVAVYLA
jgi:cytochrome c oxidase subunit III